MFDFYGIYTVFIVSIAVATVPSYLYFEKEHAKKKDNTRHACIIYNDELYLSATKS